MPGTPLPGTPPATRWPREPAATARTAPGPARRAAQVRSGAAPWQRRRQKTPARSRDPPGHRPFIAACPSHSSRDRPSGRARGPGGAGIWPGGWRHEGFNPDRPNRAWLPLHSCSRAATKQPARGIQQAPTQCTLHGCVQAPKVGNPARPPVCPTRAPSPLCP